MPDCKVCNSLKKAARHRLALEFTPSELNDSALIQNCSSCLILLQGIRLMQDESWSFELDVSIVNGYAFSDNTLYLEIYFLHDRPRVVIEFFVDIAGTDVIPWKAFKPKPRLNGHPLSPQALNWVKAKLNECRESHICSSTMASLLPDRLLSLSTTSAGDIKVKIIQAQNMMGSYAALSHCWGQNQSHVTTVGNLVSRTQEIPWAELSKTFQDAIQYCVQLEIPYIWIDALCILQDDTNDWQIQSAKMADIYQNSYITLAATWSDQGTTGRFPVKSKFSLEQIINASTESHSHYQVMVRNRLQHWTSKSTVTTFDNPLLSRAWVFQERVLSPRVLHFCRYEMIWECGQYSVCECGGLPTMSNLKTQFALAAKLQLDDRETGSGSRDLQPAVQSGPLTQPDTDESDDESDEDSFGRRNLDRPPEGQRVSRHQRRISRRLEAIAAEVDLHETKTLTPVVQWHGIVEQFSKLNLSRESDRLPALSGLASRMAPFLGNYFAGLWSSSLQYDLAWSVEKLFDGVHRPRQYRIPSWSWVSVNTGILYLNYKVTNQSLSLPTSRQAQPIPRQSKNNYVHPEFSYNQSSPKGQNPYGEITLFELSVLGLLLSAGLYGDFPSYELEILFSSKHSNSVPSLLFSFRADSKLSKLAHTQLSILALFPRIGLVLEPINILGQRKGCYRCVGIVELDEQIELRYGIDWLSTAVLSRVTLM